MTNQIIANSIATPPFTINEVKDDSSEYMRHLHAFRGFAILNVVGAHAWSFMIFWTGQLSSDSIKHFFWLTETIFHGSTIYFAIISGILFSKVLNKKGWKRFYNGKLSNVLLPYIIMTCVITGFYWQYALQNPDINNTITDFIKVVGNNLITGKASIHFWYIPLLLVMLISTPLLKLVLDKSIVLTVVLILLPLVISRSPFPDFLKPQSFVFFIGAYFLGMTIGQHYDKFQSIIAKYKLAFLAISLVSSIALFMLYKNDYQANGVFSLRQMLIYIQKAAFCALALYWLYKWEKSLPKWLMVLGTYAFAIFFLHVIFIAYSIDITRETLSESRTVEFIVLFGSLNFITAIGGSILVAAILKRLIGRHARKVVGA